MCASGGTPAVRPWYAVCVCYRHVHTCTYMYTHVCTYVGVFCMFMYSYICVLYVLWQVYFQGEQGVYYTVFPRLTRARAIFFKLPFGSEVFEGAS